MGYRVLNTFYILYIIKLPSQCKPEPARPFWLVLRTTSLLPITDSVINTAVLMLHHNSVVAF